jgi:hypothetical protein
VGQIARRSGAITGRPGANVRGTSGRFVIGA